MSRLSPLSQAQLAAMGVVSPAKAADRAVKGSPITGAVTAPAFEVSDVFDFQSYFDNTLLSAALFRQNANEPIVKSTLPESPIQISGYGLALHPSSETPVAVQFMTGAQQGASQTYRLKPGEVIRPQGAEFGADGFFSGFTWGLPFGWLGGGQATLVVLRAPDARVAWSSDHNEVVYHRMRLKILSPANVSAAGGVYTGSLNWPQRFPWPAAVYGTNTLTQRGQPALGVHPTRTALSLRLATVSNGVTAQVMRMNFVGADVWAQSGPNSNGVGSISLADVRAVDITWGDWAQQAGAVSPFDTAYQTQILTGEAERYAANAGAVVLTSTVAALQDQYVDVVRWGRL